MKFTERFIRLPIKLMKEDPLGINKTIYYNTHLKILPEDISGYRPGIDDDFPDDEVMIIVLKSGVQSTIYMSESALEALINGFYDLNNEE